MNGYRSFRMVFTIFAMFCGMVAFQVNAASAPAYVKTRYGYAKKVNAHRTWEQVRVDYTLESYNVPPGSSIPRNKSLTVIYDKPSVIEKGKKFKKVNPFNLAVIAAVEAAGWAMDELTGQITKPVSVEKYPDDYIEGKHYCSNGYCATTISQLEALVSPYKIISVSDCKSGITSTNSGYLLESDSLEGHCILSVGIYDCDISSGACALPTPDIDIEWQPISDPEEEDIIDKAVGSSSSRQLKPLFADPSSNPWKWPEFWDRLRDWMKDVADSDPNTDYDPNTNRWIFTNPGTGTQTDWGPEAPAAPDDPTESEGTPVDHEWPAFCNWATALCEWMEWTKQEHDLPEPEELPVDELTVDQFRVDWDSGLGNGSCPAPVITSYMGATVEFKYDDACWFASNVFKPILIAAAAVIAGLIIAGVRSSSNV